MSIYGGVTPDQAIGANNASFDLLAGLHDREQRDHAAHWKIDTLDRLPRLVQDGIRPKVHEDEPRLHALEFVSRKLPQNAVLYEVLGLHMPASVAPSVGQRPRHGSRDAPNGVCYGDRGLEYALSPGTTTRRPYLGMGCGLRNYAPCDGSRSPHVRWPKLRWHCAKKAPPKRGLECVMQKRDLSTSRR